MKNKLEYELKDIAFQTGVSIEKSTNQKQGIMVVEIVEGKFYKTRDGRKVGPMKRHSYGWLAGSGRINADDHIDWYEKGNYNYLEYPASQHDLIAEWQDEREKEISDMSEVKFKVGDVVRWKRTELDNAWQNFKINKIDEKNKLYHGTDSISGGGAFCFHWDIELVNKDIPEPNTKWVFNDGQDFVVRVVGFNDKGQIVLEALSDKNFDVFGALKTGRLEFIEVGSYFTFENEPEKFGEFYKPWVEKVEKQKIVGCYPILRDRENGELEFGGIYQTEEQLKTDHKAFYDDSYEILDVVNVEWSED